mgnify:CR=1 FL=1
MKIYDDGVELFGVGLMIVIFLAYTIGSIYWLWISIKISSFFMFFLGVAGPVVFLTGPIGLYALLFGVPDWIFNMFI